METCLRLPATRVGRPRFSTLACLKPDWRLDFMPAVKGYVLREQAKQLTGDLGVVQEYFLHDDLRLLLAARNTDSMATLQESQWFHSA